MSVRAFRSLATLPAVLLAACAQPPAAATPPMFQFADYQLVDLTHAYNAQTIYWPTSPTAFSLETLSKGPTPGGWYYSANSYASPEHGGTHLDAPVHFGEGQQATEQIPLERLMAPAVVIDVRAAATADPDYALRREDVLAFEAMGADAQHMGALALEDSSVYALPVRKLDTWRRLSPRRHARKCPRAM